MFSQFEKGIKDTKCSKIIGLPELIQIVRNNPKEQKIETIRNLRKNGDEFYKELKSKLPYITPNCIVRSGILRRITLTRISCSFHNICITILIIGTPRITRVILLTNTVIWLYDLYLIKRWRDFCTIQGQRIPLPRRISMKSGRRSEIPY